MMAKKWKSINIVMFLAASLSIIGCSSRKYTIYQYDNGDDYICEGLRRIVDKSGKIGFADEKGNVAISPRYAFAFPFEKGMAKVTFEGYSVAEGEYSRWISREWFYVDHKGDRIDSQDYSEIETELRRYVADIDAGIGIAVIIDGKDTVSVNGDRCFPMMSVFKFPQALAVADYCMKNGICLSDTITVRAEEIRENTWSPMREKYGVRDLGLSVAELIGFILRQSDNNASDVLFRMIGGSAAADSLMRSMGHDGIVIAHTEDEMHRNANLCYLNHSTPIEMARLFDCFYRQNMIHDNPFFELIGESMMSCTTGGPSSGAIDGL